MISNRLGASMRPIDWQSISNRLAIDGEARASANPAPRRRRRRPEFAPGNTGAHAGRSEGRRLCRRGQAGRSRGLGLRPAGRAEAKAFGKVGRPNASRPRGRTSASVLCGRRAGALSGTMRFAGRPRCGAARRDCAGASGPQKFRWIVLKHRITPIPRGRHQPTGWLGLSMPPIRELSRSSACSAEPRVFCTPASPSFSRKI